VWPAARAGVDSVAEFRRERVRVTANSTINLPAFQ
jgi:hypothetical protein